MADEELLSLLREIRDSQNAYITLYKDAVANQQASIDLQKKAIGRQKASMFVGIVVFAVLVALLLSYR